MSTLTMVEQTNPGAQSAGQQKVYPIAGGLARVDSTGNQKIILDSGSAVNVAAIISIQNLFGGL